MSDLIDLPCSTPAEQVWNIVSNLSSFGSFDIVASGDGRSAVVSSASTSAGGLNYPGAWLALNDVAGVNGLLFRRSERGPTQWTIAAFVDALPDLTNASPSRSPSTTGALVVFDDKYPIFVNGSQLCCLFLQETSPYGFVFSAVDPATHRVTTSIVWNPIKAYPLVAQRVLPEPHDDATRYRKVYPGGRRQVPRTIVA